VLPELEPAPVLELEPVPEPVSLRSAGRRFAPDSVVEPPLLPLMPAPLPLLMPELVAPEPEVPLMSLPVLPPMPEAPVLPEVEPPLVLPLEDPLSMLLPVLPDVEPPLMPPVDAPPMPELLPMPEVPELMPEEEPVPPVLPADEPEPIEPAPVLCAKLAPASAIAETNTAIVVFFMSAPFPFHWETTQSGRGTGKTGQRRLRLPSQCRRSGGTAK
jgi:hypothetical protein